MGTVLLHRKEGRRYIIDGQQRLTALCVLHWHLHDELPPGTELSYRSVESRHNIHQALECFRKEAGALPSDLFRHLCFTVIEVPTQDLAFAFFDTQNHRGVRLHATDLLKAHHLRAIKSDGGSEALELDGARRWERLQQDKPVLGLPGDHAPALFNLFLWRGRRWVGRDVGVESHDAVLHEFQARARKPPEGAASVPLHVARSNRLGRALVFDVAGSCTLQTLPLALDGGAADLPFALRQPISRGLGFFLFADKYAALIHELLDPAQGQTRGWRELYRAVFPEVSVYLREVFLLASLMYADRFGAERLLEFGLRLEHVLGSICVEQRYVMRETARNFFRDGKPNLLDVIAAAFIPDEVAEHLATVPEVEERYRKRDREVGVGRDVRGRYKAAVLRYYGQVDTASLQHKHQWMNKRIDEARNV